MNAIFNTLLRANFRCGRMSHFRAVQQAGGVSGPNVTAQAYKTGKYAR